MRNEGDNFGVGMTMTRIVDGRVEPIKDRRIEKRVEMLINGDVDALIAKRDEAKRQADALKAKLEANSKVFQERKHYKNYKYAIKNVSIKAAYDMVSAYDRVIASLTGV
jgi:hypothetical protein